VNTASELPMAAFYEDATGFETLGFETFATREEAVKASMAVHPAGKRVDSSNFINKIGEKMEVIAIRSGVEIRDRMQTLIKDERGDVPGWVLVVLMTTGLVTGIWTLAAPRLNLILRNSLDSMNAIR